MIDIELIRREPKKIATAVAHKGFNLDTAKIITLDEARRKLKTQIDELRAERNQLSIDEAKLRGAELKHQLHGLEEQFAALDTEYQQLIRTIPNLPTDDTPVGKDESENQVIKTVGKQPQFNFTPREHWELGDELGLIDNQTAAAVSGARFTYLKGRLVQLQFALIQYALSILTNPATLEMIRQEAQLPDSVSDKPFVPIIPPVMIRPEVFEKMARLEPKDERYHIPSDDLYLVGSAEHTLGPIHMDEILPVANLPTRYVGYSTAFRREAGTYGKDTKGILRLHQFDKIEMESFTDGNHSYDEHRFFVAIQEHLMHSLGIPYQVVISCTGDLGGPNARKIDIEAWLPGQNTYRETHSADYMTDYQARRLQTRVRQADGVIETAHTNDATVFAIGRTLIAIMENYQEADGSIRVPDVLVPLAGFTNIQRSESEDPARHIR